MISWGLSSLFCSASRLIFITLAALSACRVLLLSGKGLAFSIDCFKAWSCRTAHSESLKCVRSVSFRTCWVWPCVELSFARAPSVLLNRPRISGGRLVEAGILLDGLVGSVDEGSSLLAPETPFARAPAGDSELPLDSGTSAGFCAGRGSVPDTFSAMAVAELIVRAAARPAGLQKRSFLKQ